MFLIGKVFEFEAAHRLYGLPEGHKCGRLHGHNYRVEVELKRSGLDATGFVCDFGELSATLGAWLKEHWDHRNLSATEGPDAVPDDRRPARATAEELARYLYELTAGWPWGTYVSGVTVWETPGCWATYRP